MPASAGPCLLRLATLDALTAEIGDTGERWLTAAERSRLQAIQAPLRRRQYLAGHWLARMLAAAAFGGEPGQWAFDIDADPRPRLSRAGIVVWASLSHSGDCVAAAVAEQPVGLDLEIPRRPRDLVALANYLFSPHEAVHVAAAPDDGARAGIFYTYWTLKEARGKRGGEGLQPSQARRVSAVSCEAGEADAMHWCLPSGGALALAAWPGVRVEVGGIGQDNAVTLWRYVAA
jgi:4'-phosphopantetheinyl transferase